MTYPTAGTDQWIPGADGKSVHAPRLGEPISPGPTAGTVLGEEARLRSLIEELSAPTDSESPDARHNPDVWELRSRLQQLGADVLETLPLLLSAARMDERDRIEAWLRRLADSEGQSPNLAGRTSAMNIRWAANRLAETYPSDA